MSYLAAILVAIFITLTNRPAGEFTASNENQMARLKGSSTSINAAAAAMLAAKP